MDDQLVPCRALTLNGLPCCRPIFSRFVHCGRHGLNPMIVNADSDAFEGWRPGIVTVPTQDHNYTISADPLHSGKKHNVLEKNNQTVHVSSVVKTAISGANFLIKHKPVSLKKAIKFVVDGKWYHMFLPFCKKSSVKDQIQKLCKIDNPVYNIVYKDLFCSAVGFALKQNAETRELLRQRLSTEIYEGIGYCLQGNFARLVNAFSSIIPEIQVGISPKEQLQNRFGQISKLDKTTEEKIDEGRKALQELEIPETDWDFWLEAL